MSKASGWTCTDIALDGSIKCVSGHLRKQSKSNVKIINMVCKAILKMYYFILPDERRVGLGCVGTFNLYKTVVPSRF